MKYSLWMAARCRVATMACALAVVSCGGDGGGGGDNPAPPAPPPAATAPQITTAPQAGTVTLGQSVTFSVTATGTDPLAYEWLRDGVAVAGANAASYAFTPTLPDSGVAYSVRVSNAAGSVTSSAAGLTVVPVLVITVSVAPAAATVAVGAQATFSVTASASDPGAVLAYQWLRDGADIAGAAKASYTTPALAASDNGARYSVRVSGGNATPVLSAEAVLTVSPTAVLVAQRRTLAVGDGYALAIRADGSVMAWGSQMPGGPGPAIAGTLARAVDAVARARAVLATDASGPAYAVRDDGSLVGWGDGAGGTLGTTFAAGASTLVQAPVVVPQLSRIVQFNGTLALDADGVVWAFPAVDSNTISAVRVPGIGPMSTLGQGTNAGMHTAIDRQGKAWRIQVFQLGAFPSFAVTELSGWPQLVQLECVGRCLAVDIDGNVWGSGNNFYGQVGDGTNLDRVLPVRLTALTRVKSVAVSLNYSFAITEGGELYSWGDYFMNGRDDRIASNRPRLVPGVANVEELVIDGNINCLVRLRDGSVWGWGYNNNGELGAASSAASFVPVQAVGINLN